MRTHDCLLLASVLIGIVSVTGRPNAQGPAAVLHNVGNLPGHGFRLSANLPAFGPASASRVMAGTAPQAALTVTGAPASAANGSSFIVGTAGGSGTGAVTFSVSGGCSNSGGRPQIAMTSSTVACVITATKAGDGNYDPATSAAVSVIATEPVPVSVATLKAFAGGADGANPAGPMVQAADGWIYGLTVTRAIGCGSAFRFQPSDPGGTFATIWDTSGQGGPGCYVGDGGLVLAGNGNAYFVTSDGSPAGTGRVFQVSPAGLVTVLVDGFPFSGGRMFAPHYGLVVGADGALYGAASRGGPHDSGGIFRVGFDGALSYVTSFPPEFYFIQVAPLTTGTDGKLYGTASDSNASANHPSYLYRVDPTSGSFEILYQFAVDSDGRYPNGFFPRGRLLEVAPSPGQDIAFVGVTQAGGTHGAGVVYRLDVAGSTPTLAKLHEFEVQAATYLGETPAAGLTRTPDGTLYATTAGYAGFLASTYVGPGVPNSGELGTVYRIGTDGVVAKVYGGPPFIQPFGPLLVGADGDLYGTSYVGDAAGPKGAVFRVTLGATKTTPVITWPIPAAIPYGTALSATQLNATADVTGTFVYAPEAGTVLDVGAAQLLSATFTPIDTALYETASATVLITVTAAAQAPLIVTGAPGSAVYTSTFPVGATGGSGTGTVTFAASGACTNAAGGSLITMTSGTGTCSITATKAGDEHYLPIDSSPASVSAAKAAQAILAVIGAPETAVYGQSFTVDASGGTGTGALTFGAGGACTNTTGGALMTMTSGQGTCTITTFKGADANYVAFSSLAVSVIAARAPQAVLTVMGAPASAADGSSFIVVTAGGSGTGAVTFSVSGGCSNSAGRPQIAMTSSTVACVITATKAGDGNYEPATSPAMSVTATVPVPVSVATLKAFAGGADGANPAGPMVQAADGWIYGLTVTRAIACGSAFRFHPSDPGGTFATIWDTSGQGGPGCYVGDGGLVRAGDGNAYFVTSDGGPCNGGLIFRISAAGTVEVVVNFYGCVNDGRLLSPAFGLTVGADGALYGVATGGGTHGTGGIYRVGLDGGLSTVLSFPAGQTGQRDALTLGSDDRLYGTAANFFSPSFVYRVDVASATVDIVYEFASADGSFPRGRLLEVPPQPGLDVAFVGVTQAGGTYNAGVVYRLDVAGSTPTLAKLHEFEAQAATYLGETPAAGLTRAPDGTLYATTAGYAGFLASTYVGPGVPNSGELGTVYRIGTDGVVAKVYGGPPFIQPFGPLLVGADGDLYGTSYVGDAAGPKGAVFRVTLGATKTTPVITWPTPAAISYGTALSATQLNAIADVAGTFVYAPEAGTVLEVGAAQLLSATFTPTDTALYETASATVQITVTPAAQAPLMVTGAPGSAVYATTFAVAATGGSGTGTVTFAVSGACTNTAGGPVITMTSGTGTCSITATKAADNTYQAASSAPVAVSATKAAATLAVSNLSQAYDGTPKAVTLTTNPSGLSGVSVTYNGATTPPTSAGSYQVLASLTNGNYQAANVSGTLIITTAALKALTLSPLSVIGGGPVQGKVTLTAKAPAGGLLMAVTSSDNTVATVAGPVTVPAGSTSATFTVTTLGVAATTSTVISASYSGSSRAATLIVNPATLASVKLDPSTVQGGDSPRGTVTLTGAAPAGGVVVALDTGGSLLASVPASVTVMAGSTSAQFSTTTQSVAKKTSVKINATSGGVSKTATLTLTP